MFVLMLNFRLLLSRLKCSEGNGTTPLYVNVNMNTGQTANSWVDALSASFAGVQVTSKALLHGGRVTLQGWQLASGGGG